MFSRARVFVTNEDADYAPGLKFSFLLNVSIACGTKKYYLSQIRAFSSGLLEGGTLNSSLIYPISSVNSIFNGVRPECKWNS